MDVVIILELIAAAFGLGFITLMIYQNIWCWPLGIVSSLTSIYIFFSSKLYAESILYVFYVLIGIYGWYTWKKGRQKDLVVVTKNASYNLLMIVIGIIGSIAVGLFLSKWTDAERPFADSSSTMFSFVASFMEAHKVLSSWFFWIAINAFSIWLYLDRGLRIMSGLMVVYFLLSVAGYIMWKNSLEEQDMKKNAKAEPAS